MEMNEATPCCKKCGATVTKGRCIAGCPWFNHEKYDRYHHERQMLELKRREVAALEKLATASKIVT
jgi:hypothetical protein